MGCLARSWEATNKYIYVAFSLDNEGFGCKRYFLLLTRKVQILELAGNERLQAWWLFNCSYNRILKSWVNPVYKILWIELVMASHLGIGMHSNTTAHGI